MGVVYLGHDTRLDRPVAIKALPEHLAADPERLARFEREARTLASLTHPNVAGIYGVEEQGVQKYLVLEYVEGETLADRLDRGPLPLDETLEIATEISLGVEAAHDAGVVHRDLKPANIKLTPEGRVKVLDFGLARAEETSSSGSSQLTGAPTITAGSPTMPGVILGTAAYMSPEQARGRRVDKRTDVWSFGVLLYEMLTGASPFVGETVSDSIGAVLHKDVDLARLPSDTPRQVRRVVTRCVERDRNLRYHHIGDARLDLLAPDDTTGQGGAGEAGRRARTLLVPALGFLLLASFAAGWWGASSGRPDRPSTVGKFDVVTDTEHLELNDPESKLSPDGTRIGFIQDDQIRVRALDSFESRALPGTGGALDIFWSPDGQWIGYHTREAIYKVSLTGGDSIKLTDERLSLSTIAGGGWTIDDRIVFGKREGLFQVSSRGGKPTMLLPNTDDLVDYHDVSVVPNTSTLLYILHRRDMTFAVGASDGQRQVIVADMGDSFLSHPAHSPSGHVLFSRGVDDRSVWAVAFDLESMETRGDPFLVERDGWQPSVSADGTLAIQRGTGLALGSLAWITRDGDIDDIDADFNLIYGPSVSPDGSRLAFSAGAQATLDVWIRDLERGVNSRVTFLEGMVAALSWSPDGREVAVGHFMPSADVPGQTHFFYTDGSGTSRPTIDAMITTIDAAWNMAAMVEDPTADDAEVLAVALADLENPRPLAVLSTGLRAMALSPDGTLLAYTSDESGQDQVYCTRFPEGSGKWQVSTRGGKAPAWSADGATLFFSGTGDEQAIYEAEVTREPSIRFGLPQVAIDGDPLGLQIQNGWAMAPNGSRAVVLRAGDDESGTPTTISIIQNWFEAFRNR